MFSWTIASPTSWIQYGPSPGASTSYELDDAGRVVTWTFTSASHPSSNAAETYTFDGDRLVDYVDLLDVDHVYTYDRGGNLAEKEIPDYSYQEVYSYFCWQ
jgi:hypothetical protein